MKREQAVSKMKQDYEIESAKKLFEVDKVHDERTLEKYQIDSLVRIYQRQNIRAVSINQYSSD